MRPNNVESIAANAAPNNYQQNIDCLGMPKIVAHAKQNLDSETVQMGIGIPCLR